jgi:hypothetical protein
MKRAFVFSSVLMLAACDPRPNEWNAYVYPDDSRKNHEFILRGFASFEACSMAAKEVLIWFEAEDSTGTYECGFKCGPYKGLADLDVCRETKE